MKVMRFLALLSFIWATEAYKIVIFAPDIANSQVVFNKRVAQTLASAGHDVTIAFAKVFDGRDNSDVTIEKNVKIYPVNASIGIQKSEVDASQAKVIFEDLGPMDDKMREHFTKFMTMLTDSCRSALKDKKFLEWLKDEKFDIAFAHPYHSCPIGLIHYAKIPTWIWLQSGHLMDFTSNIVGVPLIPSYVPPIMLPFTDEMSFTQRGLSLFMHVMAQFFWPKMIANKETQMFREEIDPNFPDIMDLAKECPLVMVNSNEFYEFPHPTLAKVVNIGGIGAQKKDAKPLPEDFQKLANARKGLVIVSFGSVAPSGLIPAHWKDALLGAFEKLLDYQFIFRYEGTDLKERAPPNLHITKWMPQSDLLSHPKTKAFLTHAGYNSLQESINAGKPLVTIGLFGDQPKNEKIALKHGFAVNLSKGNFTKDSIYEALKTVIEDPKYSAAAARLSAMVDRRPVPPEQLLVKWTEFLARFQKLDNLFPAAALFAAVFTILFLVWKLFVSTVRCIFCRNRKVKRD